MKNVKSVENIDKIQKIYYWVLTLKSIAIAMPHAFLSLLFLQKGMDYSKIAVIQSFYSLGVVLFEYPSGVLADKYKKKYIYLISILLLAITYLIILFFNTYFFLIIAWFIYGISTAMETGTIDAELIILIKKYTDTNQMSKTISKFIGTSGQISSVCAILGSCLGFILYKKIDIDIYWIMLLLILISGIITLFFFRLPCSSKYMENRSIYTIIKDSLKEIQKTPILKYIMVLFIALQIFLQIHYQLWQSFFIDCGINENFFIGIYLSFQIITIVTYKLPVQKFFIKTSVPIGIIFVISVILLYVIKLPYIQLIIYMLPVFIISLVTYYTEIKYNEIVQISNISSLTSLISTIMRLFGFISLLFASKFISIFSIQLLFLTIPIGVITLICFIIDKKLIKN